MCLCATELLQHVCMSVNTCQHGFEPREELQPEGGAEALCEVSCCETHKGLEETG